MKILTNYFWDENAFSPILHQDFNTYFGGKCEHIKSGTYYSNSYYCVEDSFFENLKNRAIYSSGDCKFLFEDSTFVNVSHPSGDGGAVCTKKGENVHNRICSFNCSTSGSGQYCTSYSSNGERKNYFI